MIHRSTDVGAALRSRQRGFLLNPFRFGPAGDPFYSSVKLLLHFDGANNSTTFTDNSGTPKSATVNGNAKISTTQSVFGGAAGYFDGVGDWIHFADSADWHFGTGDGTVDVRVRFEDTGADQRFMGQTNSGGGNSSLLMSRIQGTGNGSIAWFNGTGYVGITLGAVAFNTWYAYRFVKSGTTGYGFLNGTLAGSAAIGGGTNTIFDSSDTFSLGRDGAYASNVFKGYIDEFRWTKGVARSTSTYVLDTAAFPNS